MLLILVYKRISPFLNLINFCCKYAELRIPVDLLVRIRFDQLFLNAVRQVLQVELCILTGDVVQVLQELGMDHLGNCVCTRDERQVPLDDFLVLLKRLHPYLLNLLEIKLLYSTFRVVCLQLHLENLAVTHIAYNL